MGAIIVIERIPAFIITLGGLLIFKGLFWLVIKSQTVPVVAGGGTNLYSLLTTYYLPPADGVCARHRRICIFVLLTWRARRRRTALGFSVDDAEVAFLEIAVRCARNCCLFVLVTNQYRGVPLPALILGAVAFCVHVLTMHTPFGRYLYAIGGNEEAAFVSGVPVQRTVIGAFTLLGGIVAITGFMQTAYAGASTTTVG